MPGWDGDNGASEERRVFSWMSRVSSSQQRPNKNTGIAHSYSPKDKGPEEL